MHLLKRRRSVKCLERQKDYESYLPDVLRHLTEVVTRRYVNSNKGYYSKKKMYDDLLGETIFGSLQCVPTLSKIEIDNIYKQLYRICRYLDIIDTEEVLEIKIK